MERVRKGIIIGTGGAFVEVPMVPASSVRTHTIVARDAEDLKLQLEELGYAKDDVMFKTLDDGFFNGWGRRRARFTTPLLHGRQHVEADFNLLKAMYGVFPDITVRPIALVKNEKQQVVGYVTAYVKGVHLSTLRRHARESGDPELVGAYKEINGRLSDIIKAFALLDIQATDPHGNNVKVTQDGREVIVDVTAYRDKELGMAAVLGGLRRLHKDAVLRKSA
jgi:hypothetical protein